MRSSKPIAATGRLVIGALVAGLTLGPGCLEIDGGAVEIAWIIRRTNQTAGQCDDPNPDIARIRLRIEAANVPGASDLCASGAVTDCEFSCDSGGGTTRFNIEPGDYFFSLEPLDATGNPIPPSIVPVPPPTRRTIHHGDLADLGVWQLVVPTP